jgi:pilus assembly protein CpaE
MAKTGANPGGDLEQITVLLVDDIAETRESIRKLLSFEPDFKVVGSVGTGREGVEAAKQLKPGIIIMDINMPDMDGIQATSLINQAVPTAAVIIMSVQTDQDYLRRAMLAGARNFLGKPVMPDELYNTIRKVYEQHKSYRETFTKINQSDAAEQKKAVAAMTGEENRAGNIIVVYSAQGGVGTTTVATNLASGLMKEGIRVLLVDADVQFGDVGVYLNLPAQTSMIDLVDTVNDLDIDLFDKIVVTHDSGLKVLLGPTRPEMADPVIQNPAVISQIIQKIAHNYDYIVIDTARHLDDITVSLFEIAARIVLVSLPTLASVKNTKYVLDLFDQLGFEGNKNMLILNRVPIDKNSQKFMVPPERIEKFLKLPVTISIPTDDVTVLQSMSKGVPIVAQRDRSKSPVREFMQLADQLHTTLMPEAVDQQAEKPEEKSKSRLPLNLRFGKA